MRALGTSAYEIFLLLIIEAMVVTLIGMFSGVLIGKGTTSCSGSCWRGNTVWSLLRYQ